MMAGAIVINIYYRQILSSIFYLTISFKYANSSSFSSPPQNMLFCFIACQINISSPLTSTTFFSSSNLEIIEA